MAGEALKRRGRANVRQSRADRDLSNVAGGKVYYSKRCSVMGFGMCHFVNGTRVVEVTLWAASRRRCIKQEPLWRNETETHRHVPMESLVDRLGIVCGCCGMAGGERGSQPL